MFRMLRIVRAVRPTRFLCSTNGKQKRIMRELSIIHKSIPLMIFQMQIDVIIDAHLECTLYSSTQFDKRQLGMDLFFKTRLVRY